MVSIYFQLNSIDFNCFQFTVNGFSTVFNLVWIYVQLIYHRNSIGTTKKSHKNPIRILDNSHRIPSDRPPTTNILLKIRIAHGLPPWKIVWVLFLGGVNKASYNYVFVCSTACCKYSLNILQIKWKNSKSENKWINNMLNNKHASEKMTQ